LNYARAAVAERGSA